MQVDPVLSINLWLLRLHDLGDAHGGIRGHT